MTDRRRFVRQLISTAAGILVAEDALELLVEPRRKFWPGWSQTFHFDRMIPRVADRTTLTLELSDDGFLQSSIALRAERFSNWKMDRHTFRL